MYKTTSVFGTRRMDRQVSVLRNISCRNLKNFDFTDFYCHNNWHVKNGEIKFRKAWYIYDPIYGSSGWVFCKLCLFNSPINIIIFEYIYLGIQRGSPTILENVICLILQPFLYLSTFECNTTSDWLKYTVLANQKFCYIQSYKFLEKNTKNVLENVWWIRTLSFDSSNTV